MRTESVLDIFGKLLIENLRDQSIDYFDKLVQGEWKAPSLQSLQTELKTFNEDQLDILRRAFISSLDSGLHDFLFKLQEVNEDGIRIIINEQNLADLSDGLHGELFTEDGWLKRFSRYQNNEE
ncbi:hypothetical protein [Paenibacillus durus]|uniref:Epimerase n=1 Tax=Paenibacillus durus TaxID=44251 RepID=A0A089HVC8_PAEDU|nr:hypothetical protein [Paenibacillus durus]AIQ14308.1 hypothetical protein PDUR_22185 [Paenibacillus durus]